MPLETRSTGARAGDVFHSYCKRHELAESAGTWRRPIATESPGGARPGREAIGGMADRGCNMVEEGFNPVKGCGALARVRHRNGNR